MRRFGTVHGILNTRGSRLHTGCSNRLDEGGRREARLGADAPRKDGHQGVTQSQRRMSDIVANADTGRNACVTRVTKDGDPGLERSRDCVAQCVGRSVSEADARSRKRSETGRPPDSGRRVRVTPLARLPRRCRSRARCPNSPAVEESRSRRKADRPTCIRRHSPRWMCNPHERFPFWDRQESQHAHFSLDFGSSGYAGGA